MGYLIRVMPDEEGKDSMETRKPVENVVVADSILDMFRSVY